MFEALTDAQTNLVNGLRAEDSVHGFNADQIVYWHVRDAHYGQRGNIIRVSNFYEEPCLLIRFRGILFHILCSQVSVTDPKRNRKLRQRYECQPGQKKEKPKKAHRRQRSVLQRRKRCASAEHMAYDGVADVTTHDSTLACGLCGDLINGVPCCWADEVGVFHLSV